MAMASDENCTKMKVHEGSWGVEKGAELREGEALKRERGAGANTVRDALRGALLKRQQGYCGANLARAYSSLTPRPPLVRPLAQDQNRANTISSRRIDASSRMLQWPTLYLSGGRIQTRRFLDVKVVATAP